MKKLFIGIAALLGITIFTYGSVATLVNKGLSLSYSLTIFFAVLLCGSGLVWVLKDRPVDRPQTDKDEHLK